MPVRLRSRDLNVPPPHDGNFNRKPLKRKATATLDDQDGPSLSKKPAAAVDEDSQKLGDTRLSLAEQEIAESLELDPAPHYDFDAEQAKDPWALSNFARDIVKYYQHREQLFKVPDYYAMQKEITRADRAQTVDWLVNVMELFQVDHEVLYMAVKLVDLFIYKSPAHTVRKASLQLIASAAFFIASKFEEVRPPLIKDLLFVGKKAFPEKRLFEMEIKMLCTVGFDVGVPLSYSFLRRYARVLQCQTPVLAAARYYLELSLHYLKFCRESESKMAAACLLLALRVTKSGDWCPILEKYSGYKLADVEALMFETNHMVRRFPLEYSHLKQVREKYADRIFHRVAKLPLLTDTLSGPCEG